MNNPKTALSTSAGGLLTVLLAQGIGRFGYTPLLPLMQQAEGFGPDIGGYIASVNYWGYLFGALLATRMATSPHRLIWFRTAVVLVILTTALMGLAESYFAWGLIRFASGLSGGLAIVLGATLTQEGVRQFQITNWAGIYFSGVGLGIALTGTVVWLFANSATWQQQWLLLAGLSLIFAIPALYWVHSPAPAQQAGTTEGEAARGWSLPVWLLVAAYFLDGFGYVASTTFLVSIITSLPNLESWGNQTWILVGIAAAPSCILWALLIPRFGYFKPLIVIYILQAAAIVVPIVMDGVVGAVIGGALFGATFLSAISLSFNLASHLVTVNTGRLLGVMTTLFGAGQIVGPAISGWLVERTGSFDLALIMSASAIGLAAMLLAIAHALHHKKTAISLPQFRNQSAKVDNSDMA